MILRLLTIACFLFSLNTWAHDVVNVYAWGGEIPVSVIEDFERTTGITVHFSTYDSNETLYTKMRASEKQLYDVILPSSYFLERMQKQNLLTQLDPNALPHLKNINPFFIKKTMQNGKLFGIPLQWGSTGIFSSIPSETPHTWKDLFHPRHHHAFMLLDDPREVFALALLSLGYSPDDTSTAHIQEAYQQLLQAIPNIALFATEGVQAILIDEDARLGSAWNGDVFKAFQENPHIRFIYPEEGYILWIDCLAIPKGAPHLKAAYAFIDFLMRPASAARIAQTEGYGSTNQAAQPLLPPSMRDNPMIYPSEETLKRAYIQHDLDEATMALYQKLWQEFKLSF